VHYHFKNNLTYAADLLYSQSINSLSWKLTTHYHEYRPTSEPKPVPVQSGSQLHIFP
jgi:hypothetical protein